MGGIMSNNTNTILKIRIRKPYPEANNHIYIAQEYFMPKDSTVIKVIGRVFSFPKYTFTKSDVVIRDFALRQIPVNNIEYIKEIPLKKSLYDDIELEFDIVSDNKNDLYLKNKDYDLKIHLTHKRDRE